MNLQNIIVYTVLALCALWAIRKIFSKKRKDGNKCAGCDCECELRDKINAKSP